MEETKVRIKREIEATARIDRSDVLSAIDHIRRLKSEIQEIQGSLERAIADDASLVDAIRCGLVKPNFPVSKGFYRYIRR